MIPYLKTCLECSEELKTGIDNVENISQEYYNETLK